MAKKEVIVDTAVKLDELCTDLLNEFIAHQWVRVTFESEQRSQNQQALYRVWIRQITKYINDHNKTDFEEEEIHIRMKHDHLGWYPERKIGSVVIPPQLKSTKRSKISKGEMMQYMERLDMHWANQGLLLQKPDDSEYMKLKSGAER